ncbi:DNA mismatch repair endonuclease MutL [bacterium]|nr:DNA mismatch repair endonuclease MutL [bacterium]
MSPQVQILSQTLINKIAAGEVIVRPASAVKELVENAFDAGARHIRVELSQDCRNITVQDDGCGMDEENAKRAILRHSTSKIREFEDLEKLTTRGFRGEALASIISVSRFELLTRPEGALSGVRLLASGGKVERVEPVGTPIGTTIHVRDLFYNTPARLKFLKSHVAEFNAAVEILTQQALSHPEVGLTCVRGGNVRFELQSGQDMLERIEDLLGSAVQGKLLPVNYERGEFRIKGYACRPEASRKDRRWQYLLVNGRPISAKQLSYPIQEAYQGLLMKQRFPIVVLDIELDLGEVDVNVHPTKEEVRFEDERKVAGFLYRAVNETLDRSDLVRSISLPEGSEPARTEQNSSIGATGSTADWSKASHDFYQSSSPAGFRDPSLPFVSSPKGVTPFKPRYDTGPAQRDLFGTSTGRSLRSPLPPPRELDPRLPLSPALGHPVEDLAREDGPLPAPLGQIAESYIVAEWGEDLVLIDQHAAHERLLYQRLLSQRRENVSRQFLLVPMEFEVSRADTGAMEALAPILREMGLDLETTDERHYTVTALPADFDELDVAGLVHDLLDEANSYRQGLGGVEALRDQILIRMACHAAIKAGQKLSHDEMLALIEKMFTSHIPFTCPHGRPILIRVEKDQLDRQFGRKA